MDTAVPTSTLSFTTVSPDDADALRGCVEVANAAREVDSPWAHEDTVHHMEGVLRYGWDLEPPVAFLGLLDGRPVVKGSYNISEYDNLHLAWLGLVVHPAYRRRGLGTAMLEHLIEQVRAVGRTSIGMDSWETCEAGLAFAERHGFERKMVAVNRRQFLAEVDWDGLEAAYADSLTHAGDYELVRHFGPTPDEGLGELAELTAAINDAPTDDLDIEDEVFSAERIRAYETAQLGRDLRFYRVLARHRPTGKLAGHTVVTVENERPELGDQHDTAVLPTHRGHRLGLLVKAEMLRWLREEEPQLVSIDTWNAASNDHMIGVNERLGYRVMGREVDFQRNV